MAKYLQISFMSTCLSIYEFHVQDAIALAQTEEKPAAAAQKLAETAFARGSADNITCIVVRFCHGGDAGPVDRQPD